MMRCAECKGKGLCGLPRCPIMSRFHAQVAMKPSSTYQGSSPSVFIGSYGYPDVRGGPSASGSGLGAGQASAVSGRMSMRQPVRRAASRAFCPSRPIASDNW